MTDSFFFRYKQTFNSHKLIVSFGVLGLWSPLMWAGCFLRWMTGHLPGLQRSALIFILRIYFLWSRMAPPEWVIPSCVCVHVFVCQRWFPLPACTWSPSIIYRKRHMGLKGQTGQERQKIGDRCAVRTSETLDKHSRISLIVLWWDRLLTF